MYSLMGTTFAIFKQMLHLVNQPLFIVALSMFLAGVVYLLVVLKRGEHKKVKPQDRFLFIQMTLVASLLPQTLRFWSLKHLSSIKLGVMVNFSPFVVAAMAYYLGIGRLSKKKCLALLIGFAGAIVTLLSKNTALGDIDAFWIISWPEIAAICSLTCFSAGYFLRRALILDRGYSSELINAVSLFGAGAICLPASLIIEGVPHIDKLYLFIGWLLLFTLIGKLISHTLFNKMLTIYDPTFLSLASFLRPLSVMIIGWIFLGEAITWHFIVSMVLIIYGLILYYQEDLKIYRS